MDHSDLSEVWQKCLSLMENIVEKPTFEMCIKTMKPVSYENQVLKLTAGSFIISLLKKKTECLALMEQVIKNLISSDSTIELVPSENEIKTAMPAADTPLTTEMPVIQVEKEEKPKAAASHDKIRKSYFSSFIMNPRYTFKTFVVGESNNLAFSASHAVAVRPGKAYNPLFIYGGVGLGKTHLLQAIANEVAKNNAESIIEYISTEKFASELIRHLQENKMVKFKEKYRRVDVLLIDDIQFLIGKEGTQDEFFHTFNELYNAGKQIVISSDRLPKEIPNIHERLKSRFEWGLTVDIQAPDIETRHAILLKKAETENIRVPQDVITYIAEKITANIRELEGALIRVVANASLLNKEINIDLAKDALKNIIPDSSNIKINAETIQKSVSKYFGLKPGEITSSKRDQKYSYPRHIAMYLTREMTNLSYLETARAFGKSDHTTVKHAYDKICTLLDNPADRTKSHIENIKNLIKEGS